jgi:hypothetical protein
MDLVSREEFDAVKAMAAKARADQEALLARIASLERIVHELEKRATTASPAPAKSAAPRKKQPSKAAKPSPAAAGSAKNSTDS